MASDDGAGGGEGDALSLSLSLKPGLVPEPLGAVRSRVASRRSGGRAWVSETSGAPTEGKDAEGGCGRTRCKYLVFKKRFPAEAAARLTGCRLSVPVALRPVPRRKPGAPPYACRPRFPEPAAARRSLNHRRETRAHTYLPNRGPVLQSPSVF